MSTKSTILFQVGQSVRIRRDYIDGREHRKFPGIVVRHEAIICSNCCNNELHIDNWIQFESGDIEPFGNWEIEVDTLG